MNAREHQGSFPPWPRLVLEGLVVIASILIAFAIDAWWEDRGDRRAEQLLLDRLRADFEAVRPELLDVQREHQMRQDACITLLEMLSVGDELPFTPQVDRLVSLAFIGSRTFQPGTGAIDAFFGGEGARLIGNSRLADLLLLWSGLVEELQEEEQRLLRVATERWTPYLSSRTNLAPYIRVFEESNPVLGEVPDSQQLASSREPVRVDQEFLNYVLERFTYQSLATRDIEPILNAVDEILQLLTAELARGR
jgi:hypothetical protein